MLNEQINPSDFHRAMVEEIKRQNGEGYFYSVVTMEMPKTPEEGLFHMETTDVRPGNPAHDCYSVAKSVSAIAVGLMYDRGLLSETDTVRKHLGEYLVPGTDQRWGDLTLDEVMRHRTGAEYGTDLDDTNAHLWSDPEWLHTLFAAPITGQPGKDFVYSDGSYYILGRVVEKLSGMDMEQLMNREVFVPLGFHVNAWSRDVNGHTVGGTGLYCRTEDMARLGWLYMNNGMWGDKRIFSEAWAEKCLYPVTDEVGNYGYGMCRLSEGHNWGAGGMCNQGFNFDQDTRRVVAWHAYDAWGKTHALVGAFVRYCKEHPAQ